MMGVLLGCGGITYIILLFTLHHIWNEIKIGSSGEN
jgi:hypothetical protein